MVTTTSACAGELVGEPGRATAGDVDAELGHDLHDLGVHRSLGVGQRAGGAALGGARRRRARGAPRSSASGRRCAGRRRARSPSPHAPRHRATARPARDVTSRASLTRPDRPRAIARIVEGVRVLVVLTVLAGRGEPAVGATACARHGVDAGDRRGRVVDERRDDPHGTDERGLGSQVVELEGDEKIALLADLVLPPHGWPSVVERDRDARARRTGDDRADGREAVDLVPDAQIERRTRAGRGRARPARRRGVARPLVERRVTRSQPGAIRSRRSATTRSRPGPQKMRSRVPSRATITSAPGAARQQVRARSAVEAITARAAQQHVPAAAAAEAIGAARPAKQTITTPSPDEEVVPREPPEHLRARGPEQAGRRRPRRRCAPRRPQRATRTTG